MKKLLSAFVLSLTASIVSGSSLNAAPILKVEPNDSFATALNLDAYFNLDPDPNIDYTCLSCGSAAFWPNGDISTFVPHASVQAVGNGTFDFYRFTVTQPATRVLFDLDYGWGRIGGGEDRFDAALTIHFGDSPSLDSFLLADQSGGDSGSVFSFDPGVSLILESGTVWVKVMASGRDPVPFGSDYVLHISADQPVQIAPVPEPSTASVLGLGLLGALAVRRWRMAH